MKKQKELTSEEINACRVQFKPILGIHPQTYIPIIWAVFTLLLVFLLFAYPGIRRYGSNVIIDSLPEGAAVHIDGRYLGVTPWAGFVSAGTRGISISKLGFKQETREESIGGQVLFSLLYRPPLRLDYTLDSDNHPEAVIESAISTYAMQSSVFSSALFPYQAVIADAARDLAAMGAAEQIAEFLTSTLPHIESDNQWYDFLQGVNTYSLLTPGNQALQIAGLFLDWSKDFPAVVSFAKQHMPGMITGELLQIFDQVEREYHQSLQQTSANFNGATKSTFEWISVAGISFRKLKAGRAAFGYPFSNQSNLAYVADVPEYYVMEHELRKRDYLRFLAENPEWQLSNIENLLQAGKVTKAYLENIDALALDDPIPYISWHSANAVAKWLTSKLEQGLADMHIRLPYETEWEYAAMVYEANASFSSSLWEWTYAWYVAVPALADVRGGYGYEKAVRGGSQYTQEANARTRGSQPPDWCTPYLGARFILIGSSDE